MTNYDSYLDKIESAQSITALENLTEKMAYDEELSNEQFCSLVSKALRRVDAGILKEEEKHWDGSWSDASLPYLGW